MKYKDGIGIGMALIVVLALIIWPSQMDLDRLREMYERGQYEAVYTQLERELKQKPHWHEARELLILSAMEAGRVDLALVNLAELVGAGESGEILEGQLDLWLRDNVPGPEHTDAAVEAARAGVQHNPDWSWVKNYYLNLLVRLERAEEIPGALELILIPNSPFVIANIQGAWKLVAENSLFTDLWQVSTILDNYSYDSWRKYALVEIWDLDKLKDLHEQHPRDPILAAGLAQRLQGRVGLDFLGEWETDNTVDLICSEFYSTVKGCLLSEAEEVSPEDFVFVRPAHILQAAVESSDDELKQVMLNWLEKQGHYLQEVSEIRESLGGMESILSMQAPFLFREEELYTWFWEERNHSYLSPDGNKLGLYTREGASIINLDNHPVAKLEGNKSSGWFWAPDSKRAAVSDGYSITIFSGKGELMERIELEGEILYPVGWQGNDKLWVLPWIGSPANPGRPIMYDLESGEAEVSNHREAFPGPAGNLAWGGDRGEIVFQRDEETVKLPQFLKFISWLPDGEGLLLQRDFRLHIWADGELTELEIKGKFLGWRSNDEFYWTETYTPLTIPLGEADPLLSSLKTYNIRTEEVTDYNLPGFWETAWADKAISRGFRIAVYRLP